MLSSRIIALRKALSLSQAEFAAKIGVHLNAVSKWELGKVEIKDSSLLLLELVYNVNPAWLRDGSGEMFLPSCQQILEPILKWMKTLDSTEAAWLKIEMEQKNELYKKWLEKQYSSE